MADETTLERDAAPAADEPRRAAGPDELRRATATDEPRRAAGPDELRRAATADDPGDVDGRRARGRRTRDSILHAAVDLASVEGLDGLTIGRLATALGMSKSGLFAHFGSKEELQLATIEAAARIYLREVIEPAREAEPGLPRLVALMDHWLDYLQREVFKGGCFFDAVRNEYDSRPSGPVRDAIWDDFRTWKTLVANRVRSAQAAGHLDPEADPEQVAFELDALGGAANVRFQLDRDPQAFDRARRAIHTRLDALKVH